MRSLELLICKLLYTVLDISVVVSFSWYISIHQASVLHSRNLNKNYPRSGSCKMAWYNNLNIFLAFVKHYHLESSWKWEIFCLWNWCQFAAAVWPSTCNSNKEQDWWWFKNDCHSILLLWKCVAEPDISSFQCLVFHNEKLKLINGVLEGCDQLAGDPTTRNLGYVYLMEHSGFTYTIWTKLSADCLSM